MDWHEKGVLSCQFIYNTGSSKGWSLLRGTDDAIQRDKGTYRRNQRIIIAYMQGLPNSSITDYHKQHKQDYTPQ